ncbi:MAG: hypothetical protein EOO09_11200 [Chitinophagaceae bacterium]|nr:MAG: hypothetical protein EOO09_11200 [Chitinophagaceae bacterium]
MKKTLPFLLLAFLLIAGNASAQITTADKRILKAKEDSLSKYSQFLVMDSMTAGRMINDSIFTRALVRSLQVKNSFYYPFDSVMGVSKIYAPDSSFRIFTWNLQFDDYYSRQKGAIQMRTADGSLKLKPLQDVSEFSENPEDSLRDRLHWIGAVYYNIIKTQFNGKNYYTLFGFDPNGVRSSKKWIDVLTFDAKQEPVFGGPYFTFEKDSVKRKPAHRISLEYKKDARVLLNYVPDLNIILADHLVSESDEPENAWTLVPDGDNEAYKWENGKWVHIDKAFDFEIDMNNVDPYLGKPPMGDPILDRQGNTNEQKLQDKSEKNRQSEKKTSTPPVPPVKKKTKG